MELVSLLCEIAAITIAGYAALQWRRDVKQAKRDMAGFQEGGRFVPD